MLLYFYYYFHFTPVIAVLITHPLSRTPPLCLIVV